MCVKLLLHTLSWEQKGRKKAVRSGKLHILLRGNLPTQSTEEGLCEWHWKSQGSTPEEGACGLRMSRRGQERVRERERRGKLLCEGEERTTISWSNFTNKKRCFPSLHSAVLVIHAVFYFLSLRSVLWVYIQVYIYRLCLCIGSCVMCFEMWPTFLHFALKTVLTVQSLPQS